MTILIDMLSEDGLTPRKKGPCEYSSPCPACGGRDRFIVRTDGKARYWCRQCSIAGDAIDYLQQFRSMSYRDAAEYVGKQLDEPATRKTRQDTRSTPIEHQSDIWLKRADRLITWANENLLSNDAILTWLEDERGLTRETVKRFRLGWIDADIFDQRAEWGLQDTGKKILIPAGLVIPGPDRIRIRRSNPGDFGRYYVLPGSQMDPLTIGTAYENTAVVVESELDALLLCQEIDRPVYIVATGTAAARPDDDVVEQLLTCPVVLVAFDSDVAGENGSDLWLNRLPNAGRTATPLSFGKDFAEAYLHGLDLDIWMSASMTRYCRDELAGIED